MTEDILTFGKMKKKTALWLCDVDFWHDEVNATQVLLEKNLPKIDQVAERKRLDQFQNQVIYYRDELLPEMKHDLQHFKERLTDEKVFSDMQQFHLELGVRVDAIHDQMKERRRQIELFINNI